jgi:hypothetical protein
MPDKKKLGKVSTKITPATVRGVSSSGRSSNVLPSNIGPARLSGNLQGAYPKDTLLPSNVRITQGYRPGHTALDIAGPQGINIYAPERMYINQAGPGPWGIDVIGTDPATGNRFTFGHFAAIAPGLVQGQIVPAGTLIGYEGSTFKAPGYSTGPHVHLQVNSPGGAAIMPTSKDILNTFVAGLSIGGAGKVPKQDKGKSLNTNLLTTSPAVTSSQESTGQVTQAADTGDLGGKTDKTPGVASSALPGAAGGLSGLLQSGGAASGISKIAGASFLASHSSRDYLIMGIGLVAFLFGIVLLYGQLINKEYNRELNLIDKTSASVEKATGAIGKVAALS